MELQYTPPHHGIHKSLFAFGCQCATLGLSPNLAESLIFQGLGLEQRNARRRVEDREIEAAVRDAYTQVCHEGSAEARAPKYPSFDRNEAHAVFLAKNLSIHDLRTASPIAPPASPDEVLAVLYSPGDLVCVGRSANHTSTLHACEWIADSRLKHAQFIVPHAMTAHTGTTKSGRKNRPRTNSNTGPRKWVVCDFDDPPPHWQPRLIIHLAEFANTMPTLVLNSGNKSLHAWFPINGASPKAVRLFEDQAALLGSDPALFGEERRCQLVRLPNGIRDNGKHQEVVFWNPNGAHFSGNGGNH